MPYTYLIRIYYIYDAYGCGDVTIGDKQTIETQLVKVAVRV